MDELNVSFVRHAMNAVCRLGSAEREDVERYVASQSSLKQHYQAESAKAVSASADFHERLAWALELLRIGGLVAYHQGLWSARPSGTAYVNAGFDEGTARRVVRDVIAEHGEITVPARPMSAAAPPAAAPARAAAPVRLSAPLWARNTILYGPPGTGKTYATIKHAVALAERGELAADEAPRDRAAFDRLRAAGRIGFVTFHQSSMVGTI
jgi:Cdc6-like AAA superfamily ATPase